MQKYHLQFQNMKKFKAQNPNSFITIHYPNVLQMSKIYHFITYKVSNIEKFRIKINTLK